MSDLLQRRDLANFMRLRSAHPGDDLNIGELLIRSFRDTYALKLPDTETTPERERELRDVAGRRRHGIVRVIELGFQIIGTFSLISPDTPLDDSWTDHTCTLRCVAIDPRYHSLRLSEMLLNDAFLVARQWGARAICLHVQVGAHGVARLYESFGFIRCPAGDKIYEKNPIEAYLLNLADFTEATREVAE